MTRQRRLSVPSSSGPEGIDPNLVASYLDNELDSDAVAEYEKKCLSHDVVLAEVASVHQILKSAGAQGEGSGGGPIADVPTGQGLRGQPGTAAGQTSRRFAGASQHADQSLGRCRSARARRGSSVLVPGSCACS